MSFHKKNIHSLPKKSFFWFEPPRLLPPPNPQEILVNFHTFLVIWSSSPPSPPNFQ